MKKSDFFVGKIVYLKTISNKAEPWKHEKIFRGRVTKVGRKYITVNDGGWDMQFDIEDDFRQKTDYSPDVKLFLAEQDVHDHWQKEYLTSVLQKVFAYGRVFSYRNKQIDLESLIAIAKILDLPVTYKEENNGDFKD